MITVYARLEYRGTVLVVTHNSHKTHPLQAKYYPHKNARGLHAEIAVLAQYLSRQTAARVRNVKLLPPLGKCALRVWRFRKDGTLALAKPCSGCQAAIAYYELGEVLYTNNKGIWEILTLPEN